MSKMEAHFMLLVIAVAVSTAFAQNPWFCQSYDCPAFTSEDRGTHELRSYEESTWVATSAISRSPSSRGSTRGMFGKLFAYISGDNSNGARIDMTVPVLTKYENRTNDFEITMMFYLPSANPPTPTDSSVFLVTRPAMQVYVKSFPGWWWPRESTYWDKMKELKRNINDKNMYNDNIFYKAGYNSPYDFFRRKQHEVWIDRTAA